MPVAGTRPKTPIAALATTEESLRSSTTEATPAEEGRRRTCFRTHRWIRKLNRVNFPICSRCSGSITVDSVVAEEETAAGWRSPGTMATGPSRCRVTNAWNSESAETTALPVGGEVFLVATPSLFFCFCF